MKSEMIAIPWKNCLICDEELFFTLQCTIKCKYNKQDSLFILCQEKRLRLYKCFGA